MSNVTNYQCPNCSGPLHFDSKTQMNVCDYCGSTFTTEEIEKYYQEKNEKAIHVEENPSSSWSDEEAEHLRTFTCPSCGAQLTGDETMAATNCPYCGNPNLIPSQFEGSVKPKYVIPFEVGKEEAQNSLIQFYKGKPFLPKSFRNENEIEKIKGVYVPFWLFDGKVHVEGNYNTTQVRVFRQGDDEITETKHFHVERAGDISFARVPTDASSKMKDSFMDAIEPFEFDKLTDFKMAYFAGYYADRYDVSKEDDTERATNRMKNTAKANLRDTVIGYASVMPVREDAEIMSLRADYAFLPVWLIATKWKGKSYQFALNGQTGKMIGDNLPIDWGKVILTFVGLTVLFMVIFYIIFTYVLV